MSKLPDKDREKLSESFFAFPKEHKEYLKDTHHIQEAVKVFIIPSHGYMCTF